MRGCNVGCSNLSRTLEQGDEGFVGISPVAQSTVELAEVMVDIGWIGAETPDSMTVSQHQAGQDSWRVAGVQCYIEI